MTIGATASFFGPLVGAIAQRFHESIAIAGTSLSMYFVGGFVGVMIGWFIVQHLQGRVATIGGLLSLALGSGCVVVATHLHQWSLFCAATVVLGVGFGALDFSLNTILGRSAIEGRAQRLSFANAFWGVGSILGPLLIAIIHPQHFVTLFAIIAVASLLLSPLFRGLHAPALRSAQHEQSLSPRPVLVTFIIAFILYVSVEMASSGWMATSLHSAGFSERTGAIVTASFWGALTVGRMLGGRLHRHLSAQQLVVSGLIAAIVLSLAATVHVVAPFAFVALGLAIANVYVFGIIWFQETVGTDNRGLSLIIVWTMAGGVLGPSATSFLVARGGLDTVPISIALLSAATLVVFLSSRRFPAVSDSPTSPAPPARH